MLHRATLASISEELRSGDRSVGTLLEEITERMDDVEPEVRAFVPEEDRWERVEAAVGRLREQSPDTATRGTLHGVPVGVKDIYHVDGFPTRAGASVPAGELAGPEAAAVTALADAGAFVLGKTVTTEFAYYDPGPTRNPHDLDHTPGGSSSGSAAAVAAGLVPLALGTQTYGSINRPASFCGVVGVKPSYGRIPTEGVLDLSPSADHAGYFTQDVPGARQAAAVLYEDWRPLSAVPEPTVGVPQGPYLDQADAGTVAEFDRQVDALAAAGFDVVRLPVFDDIEAVNSRHHRMVAAEAALVHDRWFRTYGDEYGAELTALIEEGYDVSTEELAGGRTGRDDLRSSLHARMDDHGVDVVVSPSAPGPAPEGIDDTGDPVMNVPWTHAGLPTVTVHVGTIDDLPIGLQVAARYGFDEWLLHWAEALATAVAP